jgi:predicted ester cyclase
MRGTARPSDPRRMHAEANKQVVRRFVDEYQTAANEQSFAELLHPEVVDRSRPPGIAEGAEGVRQQFEAFRAAFPDFHAVIHDQIAEGDKVVTRKVFHGTHRGELMGIAPTGREVQIEVIDIVRIEDGQIVEHWNVVDRLGLLQQLGALDGA